MFYSSPIYTGARQLVLDAEELWPATPDDVPALNDWLHRLEELKRRLPDHRDTLARLEEGDIAGDPAMGGADELSEGRLWWIDTLRELLALVDRIDVDDPFDAATRESIERRLQFASTLEQRSLHEPAKAWAEAIAAIRDPGTTPATVAWRFARSWASCRSVPTRTRDSGSSGSSVPASRPSDRWPGRHPGRDRDHLRVDPGRYLLDGRPADDPAATNYDPLAKPIESPVHEVTLDPFFLSKYEMTQDQWLRLTGEQPSRWLHVFHGTGVYMNDHPVENITWLEAREVLRRHGMNLPTEAQWEYACRAGTSTIYFHGDDPSQLHLYANLRDASLEREIGEKSGAVTAASDDERVLTSEAGVFRGNPFGLHDILGNVLELCLDRAGPYELSPRPGDGLRAEGEAQGQVVRRGGCFRSIEIWARPTNRSSMLVHARGGLTGVRPARPVQR